MWDGSATPGSANVPVNQPGQTAALYGGGVVQATAPPMNPAPPVGPFPSMTPDGMWFDPFAPQPLSGPRPPSPPLLWPPKP